MGEVAAGVLVADAVQAGARRAIALMQSTVKAASDLGESINAVQKTFEGASGRIEQFGATAAKEVGLSARAFNQMATPLGAILKNQGLALEQVADETINLTKRAADMASVFNTDVTEALFAIQAGLRGEAEPLRRYGVTLSEVSIQQKALATTGKASAAELTAQEKAVARLGIIYEQTASTAGDFADTSDGLANSQRIAAAQIENAQAKIGQAYLPIAAKAAAITGELAETFSALPKPLQTVLAGVVAVGAAAIIAAPRLMMVKAALDKMAASGSLAAKSLGLVVTALVRITAIIGILAILREIAKEFGVLNDVLGAVPVIGDNLVLAYGDVTQTLEKVGGASGKAAEAQRALTATIEEQVKEGENLVSIWEKIHGTQLSADEEMLGAKEAIDAVGEAFKKNTDKVRGNSRAALENRIAMERAAKEAVEAAEAYREQTGDVEGARRKMEQLRKEMVNASGTTGAARREVERLSKELFALPPSKTITVTANIRINEAKIRQLTRQGIMAHGGISGAETGGARGGLTWVGEAGPELVRLPYGSTVYPTGQSMLMASKASQSGGGARIVIEDRTTGGIRARLIDERIKAGIPESTVRANYP